MKNVTLILFLLINLNTFGQNETKEEFVNQVYREIIGSDKSGYYMYDSTSNGFDKNDLEWLKTQKLIPSKAADEIFAQAEQKHTREKWNFSGLLHSKPCNKDSLVVRSAFLWIPVPAGDTASERLNEQTAAEIRKDYKGLYSFSTPFFDHEHRYAVMIVAHHCGMLCGSGSLYFFHKKDNKWELIKRVRTWIS
jgi:hypothetical protein